MVKNAIQSDLWTFKMATGSHFKKKTFTKKVAAGRLQLDINSLLVNIYIYIQTALLGTREYTLCSPFRANADNSSLYKQLFVLMTHYGL